MALRQEEFTSLCDDVDLDRDRVLVERCQAGDSAAFGNLYARYYERLLRFCLRRLNDRHEAEDAAQEAFARAWKALPKFAGERRFYPWLTVIAGNICTDVLRRRSRSTPTDDLELGAHQPVGGVGAETSEELILAAVDGQLVNRALDRLSVRHRHVLAMREGSGWTYQQMADHEGVEIGTIETLLWRARQALKREFNVLSESKGALAGFLVGAGAFLKRNALRVAHRGNMAAATTSGSGGLRNVFTGVAVTGAAVAAAFVVPSALSTAHTPLEAPPAVRSAAALASPPLPLLEAGSAPVTAAPTETPSEIANDGTVPTGLASAPGGTSLPTASGPTGGLPTGTGVTLPPVGGVSGILNPVAGSVGGTVSGVTKAVSGAVSGATSGVSNAANGATGAISGLSSSLGLSAVLAQLGLVPTPAAAPASTTTTTAAPLLGTVPGTITKTVGSILNQVQK